MSWPSHLWPSRPRLGGYQDTAGAAVSHGPAPQIRMDRALVPCFRSFATIEAAGLKPAGNSAQAEACGSRGQEQDGAIIQE